jgi:hypothetical protein
MTRTIARLAARLTDENGIAPSDEEIARLLAISPRRVALHRARLAGGGK